mmetsp:Transcript_46285/g.134133  ORF Transcript_46285/g.134133 Transcript_46285/m.134133 type:complete len:83 (-) Transcript_46285:75-323(-)
MGPIADDEFREEAAEEGWDGVSGSVKKLDSPALPEPVLCRAHFGRPRPPEASACTKLGTERWDRRPPTWVSPFSGVVTVSVT